MARLVSVSVDFRFTEANFFSEKKDVLIKSQDKLSFNSLFHTTSKNKGSYFMKQTHMKVNSSHYYVCKSSLKLKRACNIKCFEWPSVWVPECPSAWITSVCKCFSARVPKWLKCQSSLRLPKCSTALLVNPGKFQIMIVNDKTCYEHI